MYTLTENKEKNIIYIYIYDKLEESEIASYVEELKKIIDNMDYGFNVCADLRDADISVLKNSDNFQPIREYGAQKGVKAAVRIMTKAQITMYKNENFKDPNKIVENEKEAEAFLGYR